MAAPGPYGPAPGTHGSPPSYRAPPPASYPGPGYPVPGPQGFAYQMPAYWAPPVPMPEAPSANTAFILGLVGVIGALASCILGFVGIGAIIVGRRANEEIRKSGGMLRGRGKVQAGIICGWIGTVIASLYVVLIVVVFLFVATTASSP